MIRLLVLSLLVVLSSCGSSPVVERDPVDAPPDESSDVSHRTTFEPYVEKAPDPPVNVESLPFRIPEKIWGGTWWEGWKERYQPPPKKGEVTYPHGVSWRDSKGEHVIFFTTKLQPDGAECLSTDHVGCCGDRTILRMYRALILKGGASVRYSTSFDAETNECSGNASWQVHIGDWSISDVNGDGVGEITFIVAGGELGGKISQMMVVMAEGESSTRVHPSKLSATKDDKNPNDVRRRRLKEVGASNPFSDKLPKTF